ncbi:ExbD/TolR family protein [Beggiatoa leptomitoformis]|uniref:Biopolymer transporter ExbD n=1 Tax=Beggiatoa leptomitoformis TaxID=288004 RepID=A0A2N9YC21_9GAMM|nr:biopolymer transporter ExbD [Beggiatoa leptomitoformis]ALG66673.1 biopolymer transporter ExbD [Beggiatoa leptomitoformis]AUI68001.1 biopolymer transporter ExbD [Beggiatoa leptomitoformis]
MAFGNFDDQSEDKTMAEINIIPLVDVMLVLLILFIVTAPLLTPHAFQLELPKASTEPVKEQPKMVAITFDAAGDLFWEKEKVNIEQLTQYLHKAALQTPEPSLQLQADKSTPYEKIALLLSAIHEAGLNQVGFVTEPNQTTTP